MQAVGAQRHLPPGLPSPCSQPLLPRWRPRGCAKSLQLLQEFCFLRLQPLAGAAAAVLGAVAARTALSSKAGQRNQRTCLGALASKQRQQQQRKAAKRSSAGRGFGAKKRTNGHRRQGGESPSSSSSSPASPSAIVLAATEEISPFPFAGDHVDLRNDPEWEVGFEEAVRYSSQLRRLQVVRECLEPLEAKLGEGFRFEDEASEMIHYISIASREGRGECLVVHSTTTCTVVRSHDGKRWAAEVQADARCFLDECQTVELLRLLITRKGRTMEVPVEYVHSADEPVVESHAPAGDIIEADVIESPKHPS